MRTKNELYQEAMRTVAARRQMARARAEDARAEAEAAIPALRHAEEEVRVRGIRCALAGAAGKDRTEAAAALADAKQKLTALLAQSGRPADALEPRFVCPKCQDTGSVNGRTCECVHKVMQQLRRKEIEALSSLSIASFDTMELRYYPNRADEKVGGAIRRPCHCGHRAGKGLRCDLCFQPGLFLQTGRAALWCRPGRRGGNADADRCRGRPAHSG